MAKGQQKSSKESKKPKKDTSTPKPASGLADPVRATTVNPVYTRIKNKDKESENVKTGIAPPNRGSMPVCIDRKLRWLKL